MPSTVTTKERLATLEEQGKRNINDHNAILEQLKGLSNKLDEAIEQKADKAELNDIKNKLWFLLAGIVLAFIGVIIFVVEGHIKI